MAEIDEYNELPINPKYLYRQLERLVLEKLDYRYVLRENAVTKADYQRLISDMGMGWNYGNVYDAMVSSMGAPIEYTGAVTEATDLQDITSWASRWQCIMSINDYSIKSSGGGNQIDEVITETWDTSKTFSDDAYAYVTQTSVSTINTFALQLFTWDTSHPLNSGKMDVNLKITYGGTEVYNQDITFDVIKTSDNSYVTNTLIFNEFDASPTGPVIEAVVTIKSHPDVLTVRRNLRDYYMEEYRESYNWWGNTALKKKVVDMVKAEGFGTIRLPVTWGVHTDHDGKIDSVWMNEIKRAVQIIIDADLYCILNVHHDTGNDGWLNADYNTQNTMGDILAGLWKQIATEFKSFGDKLIFEGFNEILTSDKKWSNPPLTAYTVTKELNQRFIDTVRNTGGKNSTRWLICNAYATNHDKYDNVDMVNSYEFPTDSANRYLVQYHCYNPETEGFRAILERIYAKFNPLGIGVVIGEFGARADAMTEAKREEYAYTFAKYCKELGFHCDWWDDGGSNKEDPSTVPNYGLIGKGEANVWWYKAVADKLIEGYGLSTGGTVLPDEPVAEPSQPESYVVPDKYKTMFKLRTGNTLTRYVKLYFATDTAEDIDVSIDDGTVIINCEEATDMLMITSSNDQEYGDPLELKNVTTLSRDANAMQLIEIVDEYSNYNLYADYDTVALMKAANLSADDIVTTAGYYAARDGGAGKYKIVTDNQKYADKWGDVNLTDNCFDRIPLANGLYAQLITDGVTKFPAVLGGIVPNSSGAVSIYRKIQCMSYRMHKLGLTQYKTYFKPGNYYLEGVTSVYGCNWIGKGNVNFKIDAEHYVNHENVDCFVRVPELQHRNNEAIARFYMKGINFKAKFSTSSYPYSKAQSLTNKIFETYMVCADNVDDIVIDDCIFIVEKAEANGWYTPCTAFQIRGKSNNVDIKNSTFTNDLCDVGDQYPVVISGKENDSSSGGHRSFCAGGALWFLFPGFTKLNVSDCDITNSASDEALSLFATTSDTSAGKYNYITNGTITRCNLECNQHSNDEILTVERLNNSKIVIDDCEFKANKTSSANVIKFTYNTNTVVNIKNSNFNLDTESTSIWSYNSTTDKFTHSMIQAKNSSADTSSNTYTIDNCIFDTPDTTRYRYLINCVDEKITIKNCTFNGGTDKDSGIGAYEAAGFDMRFVANTFNNTFANKIIKLNKGALRPQKLTLDGNTFNGTMYKFIVSNDSYTPNFQFNIKNNTFNLTAWNDINHSYVQTGNSSLGSVVNSNDCHVVTEGNKYTNLVPETFVNQIVKTFLDNTGETTTESVTDIAYSTTEYSPAQDYQEQLDDINFITDYHDTDYVTTELEDLDFTAEYSALEGAN